MLLPVFFQNFESGKHHSEIAAIKKRKVENGIITSWLQSVNLSLNSPLSSLEISELQISNCTGSGRLGGRTLPVDSFHGRGLWQGLQGTRRGQAGPGHFLSAFSGSAAVVAEGPALSALEEVTSPQVVGRRGPFCQIPS